MDQAYLDSNTFYLKRFADVSRFYWDYYDIMEDTDAHAYSMVDGVELGFGSSKRRVNGKWVRYYLQYRSFLHWEEDLSTVCKISSCKGLLIWLPLK